MARASPLREQDFIDWCNLLNWLGPYHLGGNAAVCFISLCGVLSRLFICYRVYKNRFLASRVSAERALPPTGLFRGGGPPGRVGLEHSLGGGNGGPV